MLQHHKVPIDTLGVTLPQGSISQAKKNISYRDICDQVNLTDKQASQTSLKPLFVRACMHIGTLSELYLFS